MYMQQGRMQGIVFLPYCSTILQRHKTAAAPWMLWDCGTVIYQTVLFSFSLRDIRLCSPIFANQTTNFPSSLVFERPFLQAVAAD